MAIADKKGDDDANAMQSHMLDTKKQNKRNQYKPSEIAMATHGSRKRREDRTTAVRSQNLLDAKNQSKHKNPKIHTILDGNIVQV